MFASSSGGTWAFDVPCPQYLEAGKMTKSKNVGWYGCSYNPAQNETFRFWTSIWFPLGTILCCTSLVDIDCYVVDHLRTMEINNLDPNWLDANRPDFDQLNLF